MDQTEVSIWFLQLLLHYYFFWIFSFLLISFLTKLYYSGLKNQSAPSFCIIDVLYFLKIKKSLYFLRVYVTEICGPWPVQESLWDENFST